MIREYPSYYKKFRCIGGSCKDSCCIGWEVDIDEDTKEYYEGIEGEFGCRLRDHLVTDGEDTFIPMEPNGRCPFLNEQNLCDIITELGEESLSVVCTEYPRFFLEAGDYQQIDLSLSCMELGRIFFEDTDVIQYEREEDVLSDEPLEGEEMEAFQAILARRDDMIRILQDRQRNLPDRITDVIKIAELPNLLPEGNQITSEYLQDFDIQMFSKMDALDVIDHRWTQIYDGVKKYYDRILQTEGDFLRHVGDVYDIRMERLACYFVFRYVADGYYAMDDLGQGAVMFAVNAIRFIHLDCIRRYLDNGSIFTVEDMIDSAHMYSKEVEHDEDNVEIMKQNEG